MTTDDIITASLITKGDKAVLNETDQRSVELLVKMDAYLNRYDELIGLFQKGCINLSRANYASHKRFNSTFYDERAFKATSTVKITGNRIEFQDFTKRGKTSGNEEQESVINEKESTLKNRSKKSEKVEKEQPKVKEEDISRFDPIKMFGTIVPYQLKESQKNFKDVLPIALELVQLKNEISNLSKTLQ